MKAKTFKLFMLLAGIVILLTAGCKKDEKKIQNSGSQISQNDEKILKLVENFKKCLNSKLKDDDEMVIDSAIWYLESTLNVTYARADSTKTFSYTDSTFVTIPLSGNQTVLRSDVDSAYFALVDSLRTHYERITVPQKSILLADISISGQDSHTLIVKMFSIIGTPREILNNTGYYPWPTFQEGDNWIWGRLFGKCDNTNQGLDAAEMIGRYANAFPKYPINCYTGIETTGHIHPGDPETATGPNPFGYLGYQDFLLFRHEEIYPNFHDDCLTYDVMNYYLDCIKTLANKAYYKPANKEIIYYSCHWTYMDIPNGIDHLHYAFFTYGHPIGVPFPPIIFGQ